MIKKSTSPGNVNYKMFLSYVITFIIPLLVMGIFSYFWMGGIIREQNEKVYVDNLSGAKSELDKRFTDLDNFCYTIANTKWMQVLVYLPGPGIDSDRMDPITLTGHLSELGNYKSMNGFIENLAVYMYNTRLVIYPGGIDQFDWFFTHTYAFDKKDPAYWEGIIKKLNTDGASAFIGATPVYKYTTADNLFVYMKTLPMMVGKPCATIFYMIKKDTIESVLAKVKTSDNTSVLLLDEGNGLIASVNVDKDKLQLVQKMMSGGTAAIPRTIRDKQGKDYFVYSVLSTDGARKWKYISLVPQQDILSKVQFIKNITLLIAGFLLLAGFLISYSIALRSYRPVKKLARLVLDGLAQPETPAANEYDLIEGGIRAAIRRQQEMNESMGRYKTILLKDMVEKLLDGLNRELGSDYRKELAQHGFSRPLYAVAMLETEPDRTPADGNLTGADWIAYAVRRDRMLIAVVNFDDPERLTDAAARLRERCGEEPTIAVGNPCEVECIFKSYNEARIALDYEMLKGKGTLIRYGDIDVSADKTYHYPTFYDDRFIEGVRSGDLKFLRMYFERTLKFYISQSNLSLSIERLLFYKRVLLELEKLSEPAFGGLVTGLQSEMQKSASIDEIQWTMESIYKQIFSRAVRQKETYSNELIESILKYIDEHYSDSSLSLTRVADQFNMNHSKLSVFFKEQTGENFIDYLSKKRVNVSKELLTNQGLTIEEIGVQVGFDSVHTFRRVFKKYEVLTPGQFREAGQ